MPLTPFHLGAALLVKPALGRRLSVGVFLIVQILVDIEPGWNMATNRWPVHGPSHTLLGALSVVGALLGKPACAWLYPRMRRWLASPDAATKRFLAELDPPSTAGAWIGALLGGLTHLVLDAVIHGDLQPLAPWSVANPLLVEGSFVWMHAGCAVAAAVGFVRWAWRSRA
ncbi:MAG: hypothetical protein HYY06_33015 [Deltaproteobacteria bacterium]|nr:hypothetical protein [Deltaproteobacteria bacterium]